MTRDEAVERLKATRMGAGLAGKWVDRLSALGILELDEPKNPNDELLDAMIKASDDFGLDAKDVVDIMDRLNLKVVRAEAGAT